MWYLLIPLMGSQKMNQIKLLMRNYRERAELGVGELADKAGIDRFTVGKICSGEIKPPKKTFSLLATALGLGKQEKAELRALWDDVGENARRFRPSSKNPVSFQMARVLSMISNVPLEEVREVWCYSKSDSDYDAMLALKGGIKVGIKLGPQVLGVATAEPGRDLPNPEQSQEFKWSLTPTP